MPFFSTHLGLLYDTPCHRKLDGAIVVAIERTKRQVWPLKRKDLKCIPPVQLTKPHTQKLS